MYTLFYTVVFLFSQMSAQVCLIFFCPSCVFYLLLKAHPEEISLYWIVLHPASAVHFSLWQSKLAWLLYLRILYFSILDGTYTLHISACITNRNILIHCSVMILLLFLEIVILFTSFNSAVLLKKKVFLGEKYWKGRLNEVFIIVLYSAGYIWTLHSSERKNWNSMFYLSVYSSKYVFLLYTC